MLHLWLLLNAPYGLMCCLQRFPTEIEEWWVLWSWRFGNCLSTRRLAVKLSSKCHLKISQKFGMLRVESQLETKSCWAERPFLKRRDCTYVRYTTILIWTPIYVYLYVEKVIEKKKQTNIQIKSISLITSYSFFLRTHRFWCTCVNENFPFA